LEHLTEQKPAHRVAKKTIRAFGITRKDPISCLVTLRGEQAATMLEKVLEGVGMKVKRSSFDRSGNFAFGIGEHLDIPGIKYDPTIGIFGIDVAVQLVKPGHRVRDRKYRRGTLGKRGTVTRKEAEKYLQERFGVELA
ncbi:MAG: 50S ribosomal protein L5, partial [Candidatus Geothermarchaeales archaeon]